MRRQVKPSQGVRPYVLLPEEERAATACPQYLLRAPQCVCGFWGTNAHQLFGWQPEIRESESVGRVRRLYQRDGPLADGGERRLQQSDLADTGLLDEQLDKHADGPPATRYLRRQCRVARIYGFTDAARKLRSSPERGVYRLDVGGER